MMVWSPLLAARQSSEESVELNSVRSILEEDEEDEEPPRILLYHGEAPGALGALPVVLPAALGGGFPLPGESWVLCLEDSSAERSPWAERASPKTLLPACVLLLPGG